MSLLDNVAGPSLYGLVPLTDEQAIQTGVPPIPVVVFQCELCGVLALFRSRDLDVGEAIRAVAEEVRISVEDQFKSTREVEDFMDSPGE